MFASLRREYSSDELLKLVKRATITNFAGNISGCDDDLNKKDISKPE
jgi:hypothetical protein